MIHEHTYKSKALGRGGAAFSSTPRRVRAAAVPVLYLSHGYSDNEGDLDRCMARRIGSWIH